MLPKDHIKIGLIISLCLFLLFPQIKLLGFLIIFISSFAIDIDHYFTYIYRKKDLSLRRVYEYWIAQSKKWRKLPPEKKKKSPSAHFIFHGIESLLVLLFLSKFNIIFLYIFLGFLIHLFLDYIHIIAMKDPWYIKFSQVYIYFRNKKLIFNNS